MFQIIKTLRVFIFSLFFCLPAGVVTAQRAASKPHTENVSARDADKKRKRHFDHEKFKRELRIYIIENAGLTKGECDRFLPVFFEMKEKCHQLERQKGRALRQAAKANFNNRDAQRVLDEIVRLDRKVERIEEDYTRRFVSLIGANKTVKVLHADRRFGRKVFKSMTNDSVKPSGQRRSFFP